MYNLKRDTPVTFKETYLIEIFGRKLITLKCMIHNIYILPFSKCEENIARYTSKLLTAGKNTANLFSFFLSTFFFLQRNTSCNFLKMYLENVNDKGKKKPFLFGDQLFTEFSYSFS